MNKIVLIIILFSSEAFAQTWKKMTTTPAIVGTAGSVLQANQCPTGYLLIPKNTTYTAVDFCVMKYEAKKDTYGTAVSVAAGAPWTLINRANARAQCQALGAGYDMISNDQWQTIARNIAGVAVNWSTGTVTSGLLNTGLSDGAPSTPQAAVTDDNDPCNGTGETCSATVWDKQRRTHVLSNGNVIWDFAGNVWEWLTNNSTASNGAAAFISNMSVGGIRQTRYGATAFCAAPTVTPYCGMGLGTFNTTGGTVIRGGDNSSGEDAGIFATFMSETPTTTGDYLGFRCVYVP